MKIITRLAFSLLLLVGSNASNASLISFTDIVDPNPDQLISFSNGAGGNNQSYSFTHSIVSDLGPINSGSYGYNPLTDVINSATITLRFQDEAAADGVEKVSFTFDGSSFGTQTITNWATGNAATIYVAAFPGGLNTLLADGILNVTLNNAGQTSGQKNDRSDFLFLDSTLSASATRTIPEVNSSVLNAPVLNAIPEPGALALMGLGLVGLAGLRRRNR